jgi:hypothetical protein
MKGLTSKQHLFARVLLVVAIADSVIFYHISIGQDEWWFPIAATGMTLIALTVNLWFWWRYER